MAPGLKVPFNDLRRRPELDAALLAAMEQVLHSGWYIHGQQTTTFEEAFALTHENPAVQAIAVNSGQAALTLALRALNLGAGKGVIVPANTCMASVVGILEAGLTPVFAEPEKDYYCLNPSEIDRLCQTHDVGAVMPVHLYGQPCDMPAIMAAAQRNGLAVIEDNAQAFLAEIDGRKTGTWGQAAAHSFYPTKNLGALGDAGAITTTDAALADRLRSLRDYGREGKYAYTHPGYNARISELQSALLAVKLAHYHDKPANGLTRTEAAQWYGKHLSGLPLTLPKVRPHAVHAWHLFVVLLDTPAERAALQAALGQAGIGCDVHYPIPCHKHPRVAHEPWAQVHLPITEDLCRRSLSLPLFDGITTEELAAVAQALAHFFRE